ncbi:putative nucleic acid-binding protein [Catenuloplanes nepalensis]|uniref:Nucleic acid-binding protein n=1 Tax=Catenuloplanes nepalensis TaxID=587533 RepID=A0ABT9MX28_9ACTN|nr:putative nucleic acid-binding protein [Catenuloplanes nepalensis]
MLGDLRAGLDSFIPEPVRMEIRDGAATRPELAQILEADWLQAVPLDTLDRIKRFTVWAGRIGAGSRHVGEASVLAVAEELGITALIDDRDATRTARTYGVDVHGTIWLLASACRDGKLTVAAAGNLVEGLSATGMRLPCGGGEFHRFAARHGLL